ncbi:MAG: Eco57I restriction-modification methylase domain-containing protein [Anaerovoracaceae bacterium]|jgi:adenine-specific DNA-methyltransferase
MKQKPNLLTKKKAKGRIYTPDYIVENILNLCEYSGANLLKKHVIDNSCGDGAFLAEVVRRYCFVAQSAGMSADRLGEDLATFIHGIEIDKDECQKCILNVAKVAAEFNVFDVAWDIRCADALNVGDYRGKMDFVVGNPPYVRVHNLLDNYGEVKNYSFAQKGMIDLFIVFYEIGLNMLNPLGVLGYISPSSLFNSVAASTMRNHLNQNRSIKKVVDLKHYQPFEATTYTTIMILTKKHNNHVDYYEYDEQIKAPFVVSRLNYEDFNINGSYVFGHKNILVSLQKMMSHIGGATPACVVKNGFATLYDDFFIGNWSFSQYTIPIVKASTGQSTLCLYPYDEHGKLLPYDLLAKNPTIRCHYEAHSEKLKNRSLAHPALWYGFGRSQGIKDVGKMKYAINTLIRDVGDIKLKPCEPGTGVYGGLYILTGFSLDELHDVLFADDFIAYIAMLGKYKSGGYYTYSSKDLSRYLNYKFAERSGHRGGQPAFF